MYDRRAIPLRVKVTPGPPASEEETPRAAALGYEPGKDAAPRVIAAGRGPIAEEIIAVARRNGVPLHEDPVLVEALAAVQVGEAIPPELYALVAEVLAFIYRVQQRRIDVFPR